MVENTERGIFPDDVLYFEEHRRQQRDDVRFVAVGFTRFGYSHIEQRQKIPVIGRRNLQSLDRHFVFVKHFEMIKRHNVIPQLPFGNLGMVGIRVYEIDSIRLNGDFRFLIDYRTFARPYENNFRRLFMRVYKRRLVIVIGIRNSYDFIIRQQVRVLFRRRIFVKHTESIL